MSDGLSAAAYAKAQAALELAQSVGSSNLQAQDGDWEVVHDSGLAQGAFGKAVLGDVAGRMVLFGSLTETTGAMGGMQLWDDETRTWTVLDDLSETLPDFNLSPVFGAQEVGPGEIVVGDRRLGRFRKAIINPDTGAFVSFTDPIATMGGEDQFCGPRAWGGLLIGTFGLTSLASAEAEFDPEIYLWDPVTDTASLIASFPSMGPGCFVSSMVMRGPELWVSVSYTTQGGFNGLPPEKCEIWSITQSGVKTLRLNTEETATPTADWFLGTYGSDLIATRFIPGEPQGTLQIMVWDGGGFVPLSPVLDPGGFGNLWCFAIGNDLILSVGKAWRHNSFRDFGPAAPSGGPLQAHVHRGELFMVWNQPIRIYAMRLGTDRLIDAFTDPQRTFGGGGREPTAPGTPTGLMAEAGDTVVDLDWTAPASNGGSAITDYLVEKSPAGAGTWTTFADGTSTTPSTTVTGLTNDTAYDFRVSAINAVGTGTASSTATATPTSELPQPLVDFNADSLPQGDGAVLVDVVAADDSGNGHTALVTGTMKHGVVGGHHAIRSPVGMTWGDLSALFPNGVTMICLAGLDNVGTADYTILNTGVADEFWRHSSGGSYLGAFRTARQNTYPSPVLPMSGVHVFTLRSSPGRYEMRLDGTPKAGGTPSYSAGTVHRITSPSALFPGDLSRMLLFEGELSDAQCAAWEADIL